MLSLGFRHEVGLPLLEGCKHELEITVPPETVALETERVINKIKSRAKIPGFRPGKAPSSMVQIRFADEIRREVVEALIPRHLYQQIEAEGLRPVGTPDVSDVQFEAGAPLRFKAEFEVLPDFELKGYRGLRVPYNEPEVTEEEIAAGLEHVREKHAGYRNLDPRPIADGDVAVVRLTSKVTPPGVAPIQQDELNVEIGGKETLPAFTDNLVGANPGDKREVEVTYPEDYGERKLAGKTVTFDIEILGLRSKELPELNDELAKDEGDFRNLEELRDRIRAELEAAKRDQAHRDTKAKLVDMLVEAHDFPVPEALIEKQTSANVERSLRALAEQGIDPAKLDLDWKKIQEAEQPRSAREVKAGLILDKIAAQEHIRATQEEIDREVHNFARRTGQPVTAARAKLNEQGTLNRISIQMRNEKTLQFLFEQATKVAS
ncbi:MAG TPA: trigger factor [Candidatus Acidoferrales bacterium]|nr:trigger factor [Candidatus Acidoferrales bacterium]